MWRGSVVWNDRTSIWVAAVALLVLGLALLAAPVFAQDSVVNQNADQVGLVNDSICSQVNNIASQQYNAGDQNAIANAGAEANAAAGQYGEADAAAEAGADAANIANALGISVDQVNECLNSVGANDTNGKDTNDEDADGRGADDKDGDNGIVGSDEKDKFAVAAAEQYKDDVIVASIPNKKVLVDTGGMPLSGLLIAGLFLTVAGVSLFRFAGRD